MWTAPAQGESYRLELALDSGFADVVLDESGLPGTTFTPGADIATNTRFFWRLTSTNSCGTGVTSPVWEFITEALPGECSFGSVAAERLAEDFEAGAPDWTHSGTQDTWVLSSARAHSGSLSYHGDGVGSVSDQYLVAPEVYFTSADSAADLIFWNHQTMESRLGGCYDGGLVEITVDGGSTWTQLAPEPETDPYDGPLSMNYGNPADGRDAWCGDPQSWTRTVVALDDYVGETVQLRFRLATDLGTSREGWYVDDVVVQSCTAADWLFGDDFESGGTGAWDHVVGVQ